MYRIMTAFEHDFPEYVECSIKGEVPEWLEGCLIRNGSGKYSVGPDQYKHLFDGLAVLHQYKFDHGKVQYRNKLLDSEAKKRNLAANRIVVGEFGTMNVPDPCKSIFSRYFSYYFRSTMTDNAAVNVIQMGDQLYAMTETPRVKRVDPSTLETVGEVNTTDLLSLHLNTAHPLTEKDGTVYNLGSRFGKNASYVVFKVPPAAKGDDDPLNKAQVFAQIPAANSLKPSYYHSFAMTENYIVFIEQPLRMDIMKVLKAKLLKRAINESFNFDEKVPTRFHLIKKSDGEKHPQIYEADAMFFFHTANAYEENGRVLLDVAAYTDTQAMKCSSLENIRKGYAKEEGFCRVPCGDMRRYVMPLEPEASAEKTEKGAIRITPDQYDAKMELCRINEEYMGRKYSYVYGMNTEELMEVTSIMKLDLDSRKTWTWGDPNYVVGEPVFVPRPGATEEDDGVVLSPVISLDGSSPSGLLILDGKTLEMVAKAEMPKDVIQPFSFHGIFSSTLKSST